MKITIYNPITKEELVVQEDVFDLPIYKIGEFIEQKYPGFLIKNIWQ